MGCTQRYQEILQFLQVTSGLFSEWSGFDTESSEVKSAHWNSWHDTLEVVPINYDQNWTLLDTYSSPYSVPSDWRAARYRLNSAFVQGNKENHSTDVLTLKTYQGRKDREKEDIKYWQRKRPFLYKRQLSKPDFELSPPTVSSQNSEDYHPSKDSQPKEKKPFSSVKSPGLVLSSYQLTFRGSYRDSRSSLPFAIFPSKHHCVNQATSANSSTDNSVIESFSIPSLSCAKPVQVVKARQRYSYHSEGTFHSHCPGNNFILPQNSEVDYTQFENKEKISTKTDSLGQSHHTSYIKKDFVDRSNLFVLGFKKTSCNIMDNPDIEQGENVMVDHSNDNLSNDTGDEMFNDNVALANKKMEEHKQGNVYDDIDVTNDESVDFLASKKMTENEEDLEKSESESELEKVDEQINTPDANGENKEDANNRDENERQEADEISKETSKIEEDDDKEEENEEEGLVNVASTPEYSVHALDNISIISISSPPPPPPPPPVPPPLLPLSPASCAPTVQAMLQSASSLSNASSSSSDLESKSLNPSISQPSAKMSSSSSTKMIISPGFVSPMATESSRLMMASLSEKLASRRSQVDLEEKSNGVLSCKDSQTPVATYVSLEANRPENGIVESSHHVPTQHASNKSESSSHFSSKITPVHSHTDTQQSKVNRYANRSMAGNLGDGFSPKDQLITELKQTALDGSTLKKSKKPLENGQMTLIYSFTNDKPPQDSTTTSGKTSSKPDPKLQESKSNSTNIRSFTKETETDDPVLQVVIQPLVEKPGSKLSHSTPPKAHVNGSVVVLPKSDTSKSVKKPEPAKKNEIQTTLNGSSTGILDVTDMKYYMDKVPRDVPEWRRQMLARQLADKAKKDLEEQKKKEQEENKYRHLPAWKRQLMARKDAEARAAEEKEKERQQQLQKQVQKHRKVASPLCDTMSTTGEMAPWQLEVKKKQLPQN